MCSRVQKAGSVSVWVTNQGDSMQISSSDFHGGGWGTVTPVLLLLPAHSCFCDS